MFYFPPDKVKGDTPGETSTSSLSRAMLAETFARDHPRRTSPWRRGKATTRGVNIIKNETKQDKYSCAVGRHIHTHTASPPAGCRQTPLLLTKATQRKEVLLNDARKKRLVFCVFLFPPLLRYDSNTHHAASQQASIFGTRTPPTTSTHRPPPPPPPGEALLYLCAEVCVVSGRAATPCDVRATCK